jgi:hypothetical protein
MTDTVDPPPTRPRAPSTFRRQDVTIKAVPYPPPPRRGLSRVEAAMYIGVSPSKFDGMRKDGRIGPAKLIDGRKVFDIRMLDEVFDTLPEENRGEAEDWTAAA